jgi:sulfur carrier protein ThiS
LHRLHTHAILKCMEIEVGVFATLRKYMPGMKVGETKRIEVDPGTTLEDVMVFLGLPEDEVQVIMRNHMHASLGENVSEGDRVIFIPVIDGG